VSYTGFFLLDYFVLSHFDFLVSTVHLLFFLAVIKILTAKSNRDYLYTAAIAFLELLAAAILSINLNFFVFLALYLLFAMAALTSGEIRRSMLKAPATARSGLRRFHPRLALLSTSIACGILVLTAGLFFLLPRTADAAFARLISHRIFLPGFSNQITLGQIGEIKTSSRPVMHISVFSNMLPGGLKWRGGALTDFDGRRWFNPQPARTPLTVENAHIDLVPLDQRRAGGRGISYRVELDAIETNALFLAGIPQRLDIRTRVLFRTDAGIYSLGETPPPGFGYEAYSLLEEPRENASPLRPAPVLPLVARNQHLGLPPLDRRIPDLARWMTAGTVTASVPSTATPSIFPTTKCRTLSPISSSRARRATASTSPRP
jgi:hypothetical protein